MISQILDILNLSSFSQTNISQTKKYYFMKKRTLFSLMLCIGLFFIQELKAQEYYPGICRIMFPDDNTLVTDGINTNNETLNRIFQTNGVTSIEQSFPWAKKVENRRIYTVKYSGDDELFIRDLQSDAQGIIYAPYRFSEPIVLYDPSDYQWTHDSTWLWHLRKIEADRAWDIQKGNPNTKIAVIDKYFDPNHPDLKSQLVYNFDPIDDSIFDPNLAFWNNNWHGTTVAGFACGQTTDSAVEQPLGADYASIGYRTRIIPIRGHGPEREFLESALYASTVLQADVISLSMFLSCNNQTPEIYEAMISEILDNGTVIVNAAGNGYCAGCYESKSGELKRLDSCYYRPLDFEKFAPTYPFHPDIDERIIIVTGVTKNDSLTRKVFDPKTNQYKISTHSYFQGVDVSSPGYDMWGLQTTKTVRYDTIYILDTVIDQIRMDIDTIIYNRPYPFWNGYGGTSYATPIVAGLAGLIKSQYPWLSAAEVQTIIKSASNTDIVKDAGLYLNQTGRRINAYKALLEVESQVHNYEICDSTEVTWTNPVYVKDSIVICSGSTLRVKSDVFFREHARVKVRIGGQLIIDGGRLTGEPHRLWQGVLAYSDPKSS